MSTATCPNCGAAVDEEVDDRCPECDAPLEVVCPGCGSKVPEEELECPRCGASLAHGTQGV